MDNNFNSNFRNDYGEYRENQEFTNVSNDIHNEYVNQQYTGYNGAKEKKKSGGVIIVLIILLILIAVPILAYFLVKKVVLPTTTTKVNSLFEYNA